MTLTQLIIVSGAAVVLVVVTGAAGLLILLNLTEPAETVLSGEAAVAQLQSATALSSSLSFPTMPPSYTPTLTATATHTPTASATGTPGPSATEAPATSTLPSETSVPTSTPRPSATSAPTLPVAPTDPARVGDFQYQFTYSTEKSGSIRGPVETFGNGTLRLIWTYANAFERGTFTIVMQRVYDEEVYILVDAVGVNGSARWIFVCRLPGSTSFSSTPWPDPGESISTSSQTETLADIAENKTPPTIPYREGSRASGRKGIRQRRIRLGAKEVSAYMAETDLVGKTFENYFIEQQIGEGGEAVIYLASDRKLRGRRVAIRVPRFERRQPVALNITQSVFSTLGEAPSFYEELDLVLRLQHPNILRVYDSLLIEGRTALVTEYIEGAQTLAMRARNRPDAEPPKTLLPQSELIDVLKQVASAVDYCHSMGVIHCDIKPPNLLIDPNNHVYLFDFGCARDYSPSMPEGDHSGESDEDYFDAEGMTKTDAMPGIRVFGTPYYMSREAFTARRPTPDRDLYAMMVTAFELLFGEFPRRFERLLPKIASRRIPAHMLQKIVEEKIIAFPDVPPGSIPIAIYDLFDAALNYPQYQGAQFQKFTSCEQFVEVLESLLSHKPHLSARRPLQKLYSECRVVSVGINSYTHFTSLSYAVNDSREFAAALRRLFEIPDPKLKLLLNADATRHNILNALDWLADVPEDGAAILFFAGHGSTRTDRHGEKRGYIVPVDAEHGAYST